MDGNALQYVKTRRYTAAEYYPLMNEVLDKIANFFPTARCTIIKNYSAKEDFGDGDILLETDSLPPNWMRMIQILFMPGEFVINRLGGTPLTYVRRDIVTGNPDTQSQNIVPSESPECMTVSFDYMDFQIDIMSVKGFEFNSARDYYAYNDLGNLVGRLANRAGFKFDWRGLEYVVKTGTRVLETITITREYREMLTMFGYDFDRWSQGFTTREDLFEYAASSPYFHRDLFALENLDHENRARNRKRKTYMAFLDWLQDKAHLDKYKWVMGSPHEPSPARELQQAEWLTRISREHQWLPNSISTVHDVDAARLQAKQRFNGDFVTNATGLSGVPLGQFMFYCELHYPWYTNAQAWEKWVIHAGKHELNGYIQDRLEEFMSLSEEKKNAYSRKRNNNSPAVFDKDLYDEHIAWLRSQGINHRE